MPATAFGSAAHPCFSRSRSLPRPCHPHHPCTYFLLSTEQPTAPSLSAKNQLTCYLLSELSPDVLSLNSPFRTCPLPARGEHPHQGTVTGEESHLFIHGHMPTDTGSLRTETITCSSFTPKPDKSPRPKFMNQPIQRDDWKERKVWKAKGKKHKQRFPAVNLLILEDPDEKSKTANFPSTRLCGTWQRAVSCAYTIIKVQCNDLLLARRKPGWHALEWKQAQLQARNSP